MIDESNNAACFFITPYTSFETSGAFSPVLGSTYIYSRFIVFENDLLVTLCRFEIAILAANLAKSGCFVVNEAAVSAAKLSNSTVLTPS